MIIIFFFNFIYIHWREETDATLKSHLEDKVTLMWKPIGVDLGKVQKLPSFCNQYHENVKFLEPFLFVQWRGAALKSEFQNYAFIIFCCRLTENKKIERHHPLPQNIRTQIRKRNIPLVNNHHYFQRNYINRY